jgi:signal transduction histidine kinase
MRSTHLERQSDELRADIAHDEILGLISHELQTPLTIIDGTARLLRREMSEDDRTRAIDEIATSSQRMSRLIRNMMVLARDGGTGNLDSEPMLLRPSFGAALAEHVRLHPDSPVALEADPELPPVLGDATCVDQVLTNLLSNAAKYGDPAQPIRLTAKRLGQEVLVCVANGGETIDPQSIGRLFEPFYRDSAHIVKVPGIGLGLAVCLRLIEAQGGRIWAEPRAGGGLEVCFTLPIAGEA